MRWMLRMNRCDLGVRGALLLLWSGSIVSLSNSGRGAPLPLWDTSLFSGPGVCAICHQSDGNVLMGPGGEDLSPTTDWRSTMMANAFRDPLFRAKLESEVARHPALQTVIEDTCLTCHSPMARTQAIHDGAAGLTLAGAASSEVAQGGVSCTLCHQIQPDGLGELPSYSGGFEIRDGRIIYGPYEDLQAQLMQTVSNFDSAFGPQVMQSELCATCHTLFVPYVDDGGAVVGEFPEQTPYLEWLNSVYAEGSEERQCQDCHMPPVYDVVVISSLPPALHSQSPFWRHHFVGGNALMGSVLRDHGDALGVTAEAGQFETTITRAEAMLASGVDLAIEQVEIGDPLRVTVAVTNHAGHKFPTGYPARRAWLRVTARDASGGVVFDSGAWDAEGEILGLDADFEPHHDVISSSDQVLIYEAIVGDINGDVTHTLLRQAQHLKDNRLPPRGFTAAGASIEHTAIVGLAALDPNFNRDAGAEGTGQDLVAYEIAAAENLYPLTVEVSLLYQSVSPRFAADLFTSDTSAVDAFEVMWTSADRTPITVATASREIHASVPLGVETR
jgi:Cytochrome c554 and c-prime